MFAFSRGLGGDGSGSGVETWKNCEFGSVWTNILFQLFGLAAELKNQLYHSPKPSFAVGPLCFTRKIVALVPGAVNA